MLVSLILEVLKIGKLNSTFSAKFVSYFFLQWNKKYRPDCWFEITNYQNPNLRFNYKVQIRIPLKLFLFKIDITLNK